METIRANRTKFFDLVIPVVPFISYRNARELLSALLKQAGITGIERPLVDLVARHTTDMRLLLNMRNEYLVFAERPLEADKRAPGLTTSNLFALVAYKNLHLEDFEQISRRNSDLDNLYVDRRDLVRSCVAGLEKEKRDLLANHVRVRSMQAIAERLGQKLARFAELAWKSSGYASWPQHCCQIGGDEFTSEQLATYEFWAAAPDAGSIDLVAINPPSGQRQRFLTLQREDVNLLFSDAVEAGRWDKIDTEADSAKLARIDRDLAFVRGADFDDLAKARRFRLAVDASEQTFAELVDATMRSELAGELVKRGYIDRNFALYAAQFYGDFTGVDVATFIVQNVQTNTMEAAYQFTSPGAVENLLAETDDDFTHSVSAYNIDVLNHLLSRHDVRADNIVDRIGHRTSVSNPADRRQLTVHS
ncbi:hypothetical protein OHA70_36330 [Kribbella sp. NBC_00382]|uniref:YobI family P-loop NTPase n=1 Tax=Kribbella sp. NBC_00382 TaxID=2975967 RepID=UPI002E1AF377